MSTFKIGVSPAYFNRKCDEFGILFDAKMVEQRKEDEEVLRASNMPPNCQPSELPVTTTCNAPMSPVVNPENLDGALSTPVPPNCQASGLPVTSISNAAMLSAGSPVQTYCQASEPPVTTTGNAAMPSNPENLEDGALSTPVPPNCQASGPDASLDLGFGWKIPFDNFDIYQRVRGMSEDNQNKDLHWINHLKVSNRVSGNHLPDDKPICEFVADLDNSKLLPTIPEHLAQRTDYIILIERVLVGEIPYLAFCKDVVVSHIPHRHMREMSSKSEKVRRLQWIISF